MSQLPKAQWESVRGLIQGNALRSVFQPIVDLETRQTVAYEALVRGPEGSPLEMPEVLFAEAAAEGQVQNLDSAALSTAIRTALSHGMAGRTPLFVNIEGAAAGCELLDRPDVAAARDQGLQLVFEVTERDLLARPAELLHLVQTLQEHGWGMAIDDVGLKHPEGVAALSLIKPSVVKLDMSVIQRGASREDAGVALAVQSYVEEHDAHVVAEGIETDRHLETALVLGARYGQGFGLGRPAPLIPGTVNIPPEPLRLTTRSGPSARVTPYELAADTLAFRTAPKRALLPVSHQLEHRALQEAPEVLILSAFQDARHFVARSRERYIELSMQCALVAAFASNLTYSPGGRVRGATLAEDDELCREWTVAVISPNYSAALVARELGEDVDNDMDRRFSFAVTHNRQMVAAIGTALMARIADRGEESINLVRRFEAELMVS